MVLTKFGISRQTFIKVSTTKFHGNPSSGSRAAHADRRTDVTKIMGAFRDYVKAPKALVFFPLCDTILYLKNLDK